MLLMENALLSTPVLGENDVGDWSEGKTRRAGKVLKAFISLTPPAFVNPEPVTPAQRNGIKYELKLQRWLEKTYGGMHVGGPWIAFINQEDRGLRWCQPDAILFDFHNGTITCVECKLRHTPKAYHQLRTLYLPVLQCLFPSDLWTIRLVEVVCWFDPSTFFPGRTSMIPSIDTPIASNEIGIHIWNPKHH